MSFPAYKNSLLVENEYLSAVSIESLNEHHDPNGSHSCFTLHNILRAGVSAYHALNRNDAKACDECLNISCIVNIHTRFTFSLSEHRRNCEFKGYIAVR